MKITGWYRDRVEADRQAPVHKSVDDKDWTRIAANHLMGNQSLVDHQIHTQLTPPDYIKSIFGNKKAVRILSENLGDSPKLVHQLEGDTPESFAIVMTKPYHQKINMGDNLPIYGWATMATKALFGASDMNDMIEDVHAGEHNGVPITHHMFAPTHYESTFDIRDLKREAKPVRHDIDRIAVMDFLTGNRDRHTKNLLFSIKNNKPMAIDHERNFQYKRNWYRNDGVPVMVTPSEYGETGRAIHFMWGRSGDETQEDRDKLASWWNNHKDKIKNTMIHQLSAIKDPVSRQHVHDNFNDRWSAISSWASSKRDVSLFDKNGPSVPIRSLSQRYLNPDEFLDRYKERSPDETLAGALSYLRNNGSMALPLSDSIKQLSLQVPPERVAEHFLNHRDARWAPAAALIWHQPKERLVSILRAIKDYKQKHSGQEDIMPFVDLALERVDRGQEMFDKTQKAA